MNKLYCPPIKSAGKMPATPEAFMEELRAIRELLKNTYIPDNRTRKHLIGGDSVYIGKDFTPHEVVVATTPTLLESAPFITPITVLNPAINVIGKTASETVEDAVTKSANDASSDLVVRGVQNIHIHVYVTAVTGVWKIYAQSKDPTTLQYADTQELFNISAAGTLYGYIGSLGVADIMRFRYEEVSAGSITFSLSITRKMNVAYMDISTGLSKTIYMGNAGVTTSSGLPLLEGERANFVLEEGASLYAVAETPTIVRVFR